MTIKKLIEQLAIYNPNGRVEYKEIIHPLITYSKQKSVLINNVFIAKSKLRTDGKTKVFCPRWIHDDKF